MNNIQKISVIVGAGCLLATLFMGSNDGHWFIYSLLEGNRGSEFYKTTYYHWETIIPTCLLLLCGLTFYLYKDD